MYALEFIRVGTRLIGQNRLVQAREVTGSKVPAEDISGG